jgi:puromycin-sensitive aminopeptidase
MSRLPVTIGPVRYALDLHVDPSQDRFAGEAEIHLDVARSTETLEIHSVDLELESCELEDAKGRVEVRKIEARAARESLELRLTRALRRGRATLRLRWSGPLRTDLRGLYLARSGRRRYATTQLEAADARRMFPCFDEPDRKARFRITVTTPRKLTAVSNAPIERVRTRGRLKTIEFAETPKLSTYLIALTVGELEASRRRYCGKTPIRVWCVPGKRHLAGFALEAAAESLARLERYFGIPYPYAKLDLIAVPDFEFGAMENAGAVTFRESLLLTDPKTISSAERKRVAEVMAHELAHMWFGDLVTMAWWDDLWLNEAFATWMAFTIVDQWKPEWKLWLDFEHARGAALGEDALRNTHPLYIDVRTPDEATENFDLITYEKGAAVVRMLERWLGAPAFRRGVRKYIRRHREGNARGAQLWDALEEASGQPVREVAESWIERPGFPELRVRLASRGGRATLVASQSRFFSSPRVAASERRARWPIPAVLRVQPARGRSRLERHLLTRANARIDLGEAGSVRWVYANAEESGFYRPLHDARLLGALGPELGRLSAAERIGIVGHQWAGLRAGSASLADFLGLVEALREEPEPEVLEALAGPLGVLARSVAHAAGGDVPERFRERLVAHFVPAFDALGWQTRRGESEELRLRRAALLRLAGGVAEAPELMREASRRIFDYARDRSTLDPNLAGSVVELAARAGDERLWETYVRLMRRAKTPQERTRFELGLAAFRDPRLVTRTLELSLGRDVPTQDVVPLLVRLLANREAREATWRFIQRRWKALGPRVSPGLAPRLVAALPALETRAHRREVAAFVRAHPLPTAARALRQALERFDANAEFRRRAAPELRRILD